MTRLRISMFLWGGLLLASGLLAMLFPDRLAEFGGRQTTNTFLLGSWGWLNALLGLGIVVAARDPARHLLWVRMALLGFVVGAAYDLLHYSTGAVVFGVIVLDLAAYLLFGLLFLLFYPRAPRMTPLNVRVARGPLYTDLDQGGLFLRQGEAWVTYLLPVRDPPVQPTASPAPGTVPSEATTRAGPTPGLAETPPREAEAATATAVALSTAPGLTPPSEAPGTPGGA